MTPKQQLARVGISAEADGDLVLIQASRSFALYTPKEIEVFFAHLRVAYRRAAVTAIAKTQEEVSGVPV